ncbi:hypothetical protein HHK36_019458 [Tetracentron sinense]|uniref:Gnk2-homologous domain-containing protein n=1 Tax=Tetracentron sinense TaxID=13715 RepID=A0A834YWA4_TETSI|nr:hypothetical protein HHK36_019458 [Tetracentron sinense]
MCFCILTTQIPPYPATIFHREKERERGKGMPPLPVTISRTTVLLLILCLISSSNADPTYISHVCPNTTTYTPNSTYQTNLNLLLSSLSSSATASDGFYNITTGKTPNIVYGLFLCQGNVTNDVCRDCVQTASKDILLRCPNEKVATTWYDECMLRYSNQSIFSVVQQLPGIYMWKSHNISNQSRFNQVLADTMDDLATRASSSNQTITKFAVGEANFTTSQKVYSLAQCTPDLSGSDCNRCLQGAIEALPSCCGGKQGGRVILPSCNLRYEMYPFYRIEAVPLVPSPSPSPLSPPPPSNRTSTTGDETGAPGPSPSPPPPLPPPPRNRTITPGTYRSNSTYAYRDIFLSRPCHGS